MILAGLLAILALIPALVCAAVCVCAGLPRRAGPADCLIVLGARVRPDGTPSRTLQNRCDAAAEAWRRGQAGTVIVCGGRGPDEPETEAAVMRAWLIGAGLPPERVIEEDQSTSTVENLRFAREVMEARGLRRAAVVTSDYHLTRALWIARDLGVDACGIPAKGPEVAAHILKSRACETCSWLLYFFRKGIRRDKAS